MPVITAPEPIVHPKAGRWDGNTPSNEGIEAPIWYYGVLCNPLSDCEDHFAH
jgi:hypothetical protein